MKQKLDTENRKILTVIINQGLIWAIKLWVVFFTPVAENK